MEDAIQKQKMNKKYRALDILEYFYGIIALIGLLLFVHISMNFELRDPDIWLHLKTGEYITQHKAIPNVDIFSSTISNKAWVDHSWLVQVIFYLVFHFGGPDNLIFLSAIIMTFAFLFLFLSVYRQHGDLVFNITMLFIVILASRLRFNIRPENFSILFFSVYLFILTRRIHKRWVYLLPVIQLIWVNSHGFFILGPLMVGIFILAEKLKRSGQLPWEWAKTDLLDEYSYRNLFRVFIMLCLVSFINPYGYRGVMYPFWITLNSIGKTNIFYKYIVELLPTWSFYKVTAAYFILIALSFAVFIVNFRRINIAYLMLWLIFLGISFRVNRNILFFNFFAFLTITDGLTKTLEIKKFNFLDRFFNGYKQLLIRILKFTIISILIVWTFKSGYSILTKRYYIFEENIFKSALLGINTTDLPVKAADFVLENDLPGNIFNVFNHGSYLIYRFSPRKRVFIDGRTELYGDAFFRDYQRILDLDNDTIRNVFNKYNINTLFLSDAGANFSALPGYFFDNPEWVLVYFDENSLIFLRDAPQNKLLISRLRIDLREWKTEKADLNKIGIKSVYPAPYINRGWIFCYLGLNEQAVNEANEALRMLPSSADAYNIIGRVSLRKKLYDQAFEEFRLARIYGPWDEMTFEGLGNLYMEKGKFDDAIKAYKRLIRINPNSAKGFSLLSRGYNQVKNTKLAIKSLRTAVKLSPFKASYYKELGELLYKNNDTKGAIQVYRSAIDMGLDKTEFNNRIDTIRDKNIKK